MIVVLYIIHSFYSPLLLLGKCPSAFWIIHSLLWFEIGGIREKKKRDMVDDICFKILQSLALCSSNLAIVPKCTSSGPSAILNVLAVAQRWARKVSDDNPAAPCTCIAMSSTFSAMFGAATCPRATWKTIYYKKVQVTTEKKLIDSNIGYLGHCNGPTGFLVSKSIELVSCFKNQQPGSLQLYSTLQEAAIFN